MVVVMVIVTSVWCECWWLMMVMTGVTVMMEWYRCGSDGEKWEWYRNYGRELLFMMVVVVERDQHGVCNVDGRNMCGIGGMAEMYGNI